MDVPVRYADTRKIDPSRGSSLGLLRPDGTPDCNDRVEIGPTPLAFQEWAEAGLEPPDLQAMRRHRLDRLARLLRDRDYGAILLFDPLNIRYASDTTNMQIWATHNPFRACLVTADGYMIVWDFKTVGSLLTSFNPLVRETRNKASFFYFVSGDKAAEDAADFAGEINAVLRRHCGANRRLAVDKIMVHGLRALEALGIEVMEGEEVTEKARAVKGPDEIKALRCAQFACEKSVEEMRKAIRPGLTENEIWSVLHAENIKRGGEWIETRIMSSGPRTNPWFQECGPRVVGAGELLGLDTDLVGCYGMCSDISRTWLIGDGDATEEQKRLHREAHAQITENAAILRPGLSFREVTFGGRPTPAEFVQQRYSVKMHGVGLCDEWPSILHPEDYREGAYDYHLEPGMLLCSEAYVGAVGGEEGVKLEDQILITEDGHENLTRCPFDERLL